MRYMLSSDPIGNFKTLREFESGDATHGEAFNLVADRATSLRKGWRIASDGILLRDGTESETQPKHNDEEDQDYNNMDSIL